MESAVNDKIGLIYGLVDPRSQLVRYVGKTWLGSKRAEAHGKPSVLKRNNTRRSAWIKSLKAAGLEYTIVELQQCEYATLNETEIWWIAYGRACGWGLTNHTTGGEGVSGLVHSQDTKQRIARTLAGRVFSKEHRSKISKAKTGVAKTAEHRAKLSKAALAQWERPETREIVVRANIGRKRSLESIAKTIAANTGQKRTPETKARMREAQLKAWQRIRLERIANE